MSGPSQPNQSIIDGLAVLQAVASSPEPVGVRELARQLDLEPTRVQRLLGTLASVGMAEQDDRRKYFSGPGIHVLAAQAMFGSRLLSTALPVLEGLRRHGLTVAMGVLWRDRVAYLYFASPDTPPGEALGNTQLFPADRSAIGRVLQAMKSPAAGPGPEERPHALVETGPDARSLAVPVGEPAVAAVALSGAVTARRLLRLLPELTEAAARITAGPGPRQRAPRGGRP